MKKFALKLPCKRTATSLISLHFVTLQSLMLLETCDRLRQHELFCGLHSYNIHLEIVTPLHLQLQVFGVSHLVIYVEM